MDRVRLDVLDEGHRMSERKFEKMLRIIEEQGTVDTRELTRLMYPDIAEREFSYFRGRVWSRLNKLKQQGMIEDITINVECGRRLNVWRIKE